MTKQTNGKLGSAFWTNFVRLDRVADGKHSESKLKEALGATGLQLELQPMGGDAISLIELQKNSKQARELVRAKGFRVPCASDSRVACAWCWKSRQCNSSFMQQHLVTCGLCPEAAKEPFRENVATSRAAEARLGKRSMDENSARLKEAATEGAAPKTGLKFMRTSEDVRSFTERTLSDGEVKAIDVKLARFCYSEGLPFKALSNPELRGALSKLNASWAQKTKLSDWTLRHHFLDDEYEAVSGEAAEKITAALFVCLVSDGWSGVQKRHVLNLILTTPEPVFLGNVETKEASVDGKFQAELFTNTIMANGGPAKVPAICTDNASVMRKTWRLLREKFHGLFTYGCAPHAFNLHAKDICAMPQFAKLNDNTNTIVTWFNKHLQADGRATLTRIQLDIYGKEKALVKAGATRWNSQVSAAESVLDNRAALTTLVTERDFDTSKPGAKDLKKLIVDVDDEYWSLLSEWVDMMQPLRLAIHCLQADYATLSDVFASFVRVHRGMNETFDEARCETFAIATRGALKEIFAKRFNFLYHPIHLVAFALDPRYAPYCKAPASVIRHWIKELHNNSSDNDDLIAEYGLFRASQTDALQADIWTPKVVADPLKWWTSWGDDFPLLRGLARKVLSLPPSAAAAERNWSTQDFINSKRRNRLAPDRSNKLVYIYFNRRSLARSEQRKGPGVTDEKLASWAKLLDAHSSFQWPSAADGARLFAWVGDDDYDDFDGMYGDQMDDDGELGDDEAADLQAERAAFEPFVPNGFVTLGEGFEVLPCPARLPQDLEVGQKVARWFGSPYNAWYTGKIEQVNKRKTIQDNVTAEFTDETHGTTWGHWVASADTYGADRKWVLLKPVPIELDDEEMGEAAGSSANA